MHQLFYYFLKITWIILIFNNNNKGIYGYLVEHVEQLNGQNYIIKYEQPFFRVYHETHIKVK